MREKSSLHLFSYSFSLLVTSFFLLVSTYSLSAATINSGDTLVIKGIVTNADNSEVLRYVTAVDTLTISGLASPSIYSLWIIEFNNDTISFRNLMTNRYMSLDTAVSQEVRQSVLPYAWLLYDDDQEMRSVAVTSYNFSFDTSLGYSLLSESQTLDLVTYVESKNEYSLSADTEYLLFDSASASQVIDITSAQMLEFMPTDTAGNVSISDTLNVNYTVTVSDSSWISVLLDTIRVTPMSSGLARYGSVLISNSKGNEQTVLISQWQDLGNVALNHVTGLSGRALNNRGLQETSVYVKTLYTMQDSSVTLNLASHNGGNGMQAYYCWYNYATLETMNSNLNLNNNYRAFNNNSGKYCLGYTGNVFTYTATDVTFPVEIACDASAYTDYSLSGSNFYEPTISCRYVFIIDDASVLAQKFSDANASGTSPSGYLENYNMIIPTNQIVRLVTAYNLTGNSATYFAYNKSNSVEVVENIKLYIDSVESSLVITKNKYVQLYYPKTLGKSTYQIRGTLSDGTIVNIAQYNLDFVSTSVVGPVEVSSSTMLADNYQLVMNYNPIANLWFYDLSHDAPFDPFTESDLGFCYNTTYRSSYEKTSSTNAFATCFEYQFLTTSTSGYSSGIKQGITAVEFEPEEDYSGSQLSPGFLYVNPSGNIVNLFMSSFEPANKNPNTEYFASLYINNLAESSGQNPQLTFYVEELKGSDYVPITQYCSGELVMTSGTWYQIGFPFTLTEPVGDNYRIRVENNGADWYTNTYALDQFGVYQKIPPVYASGIYQDCSSITNTLKNIVVRLDYEDTCLFCDDVDEVQLYYQCEDTLGNIMPLVYNTISGVTNYGSVLVKNLVKESANYPLYSYTNDSTALTKYLATMTTDSITGAFYSMDTVIDVERYMFYFVFQSDAMDACQDYYIKLYSASSLADSTMIGSATFVPIGECIYSIEDNVYTNATVGVCPATEAEITILHQIMVSETKPVSVNGYYDWLKGVAADYGSDGCYSQYSYNDIILALEALHKDSSYMSNKVLPSSATTAITSTQLALLNSLISDNILSLYVQKLKVALYDSVTNFMIYPYADTMSPDGVSTAVELCNEPWQITIPLKTGSPWLLFGKTNESLVTTGLNYLREARVSLLAVNSSGFVLPVKASSFTSYSSTSIGKMILTSSDDPNMSSYYGDTLFNQVILRDYSYGVEIVTNDRRSEIPDLKGGYEYITLIEFTGDSEECTTGYQQVQLIPQPEVLYWTGKSGNSWNNVENWLPGTTSGALVSDTLINYVPLYDINVIISDTTNAPILYDASISDTSMTTALQRDLLYATNYCKNIFFSKNSTLIGQEYLNYDSAWVEVSLPTKQWVLMGAPIRGLVSGDMYISSSSNSSVFSSSDSCDSRSSIPFWQSVYNGTIISQGFGGTTNVSNVGWSTPSNGMTTNFTPRMGFAVWCEDRVSNSDTISLRLPKPDAAYYYYQSDGTPSSLSATVSRPSNYYKLAFINEDWTDVTAPSIFVDTLQLGLLSNPFMTTLYMSSFMGLNDDLTGNYWVYRNKEMIACSASGESSSESSGTVNINAMEAFFVELVSGTKFSPSNMVYQTVSTYPPSSSASAPANATSISRLFITADYYGYKSSALVLQSSESNNGYNELEDVKLIMLQSNMTPASVYTISDNNALQINALSTINQIPLSVMTALGVEPVGKIKMTFTGSSSFNGALMLRDIMLNHIYLLNEGTEIELDMPGDNEMRYFISHYESPSDTESALFNEVKIYTPQPSQLVVVSHSEITDIKVYDSVGRLIVHREGSGQLKESLTLTSGYYLVAVRTRVNQEVLPVMVY